MSSRSWLWVAIPTFAVLASLWTASAQSGSGVRYAFLVGCSDYDKTQLRPLPHTVRDVEGFKQALLATGFEADHVVVLHDELKQTRYRPLKRSIVKELDLLLLGMRPADTLVVALSGHGLHFKGDKTGYFCPSDARLDDRSSLLPMDGAGGLFEILKRCKARQKLLIVNACRNDPTTDLALAATKIQLDDEDADVVPEGIAAIYSCRQGQKSYFDPDRKLSLFYDHLIRAWKGEYHKGPGKLKLEHILDQIVLKTKIDANKTLGAAQVPEVRREYQGEWIIGEGGTLALSKHLDIDLGGGVKMKLVRIEPGTFTMGSPAGEEGRYEDEGPQHDVEISKPFYMGIHEVTRGQFRVFVDAEGYKTDAEKDGEGGWGYDPDAKKFEGRKPKYSWRFVGFNQTDEHPVVNVSWNDAKAFCAWLSRKEGKTVDLPTEAEWEFSCRAATRTRFFSGESDASMEGHGNAADASAAKIEPLKKLYDDNKFKFFPFDDGYSFTAPVGRFKVNSWGLFDMHGNVWEWCKDWYDKEYYKSSPRLDPQGPAEGKSRVLRGGSWNFYPRYCRAAFRDFSFSPGNRVNILGFRVVVWLSPRTQ